MYQLAGRDVAITIDFMVDDEFVVPDVGSVTYTLVDNSGVNVSGHVDQPITTTISTTQVELVLPAVVNAKAVGKNFENRFVQVTFEVSGRQYVRIIDYRLIDFLLYSSTPQDVRSLLGANASELPDDDVDLVKAYFAIADTVTAAALLTALKAGNRSTDLANQAITCSAALMAIPGLQLGIAAEEGTDSTKYRRLHTIDFKALEDAIKGMLGDALTAVVGTGDTIPVLGFFATRRDAVTGV